MSFLGAFRASSRGGGTIAQAQSAIDEGEGRIYYVWWCDIISLLPSVVERAWTVNFVGNLDALEQHVERQMKTSGEYMRTCSIVQSSGAGKSRLMDELAKHHFLIPINLRADGSTGMSCLFRFHALTNATLRFPSRRQRSS